MDPYDRPNPGSYPSNDSSHYPIPPTSNFYTNAAATASPALHSYQPHPSNAAYHSIQPQAQVPHHSHLQSSQTRRRFPHNVILPPTSHADIRRPPDEGEIGSSYYTSHAGHGHQSQTAPQSGLLARVEGTTYYPPSTSTQDYPYRSSASAHLRDSPQSGFIPTPHQVSSQPGYQIPRQAMPQPPYRSPPFTSPAVQVSQIMRPVTSSQGPLSTQTRTPSQPPTHSHSTQGAHATAAPTSSSSASRRTQTSAESTSIPPQADRFPCDQCDSTFSRAHDRKRHAETHNTTNPPVHICQECSKSFSRADSLKRHLNSNNCPAAAQ